MEIYDITRPVHPGMTFWPGDKKMAFGKLVQGGRGRRSRSSPPCIWACTPAPTWTCCCDFVEDGKSIPETDLDRFIGWVEVLDLRGLPVITEADLRSRDITADAVFFRTDNSDFPEGEFREDFVALAPPAADYLVAKGVRTVGIDYLSIGAYGDTAATHHISRQSEVAVVEGLMLKDVPEGRYFFAALPLKVEGAEWLAGAGGAGEDEGPFTDLSQRMGLLTPSFLIPSDRSRPHGGSRPRRRGLQNHIPVCGLSRGIKNPAWQAGFFSGARPNGRGDATRTRNQWFWRPLLYH